MRIFTTFLLFVLAFYPTYAQAQKAYLLVGLSGDGKSSLANLLVDDQVAHESSAGDSCTKKPSAYVVGASAASFSVFGKGALIIDVPGFHDTAGLTLTEIVALIRAELVELQLKSLAGVILVVDGSATRLNVALSLELALTMLGPRALPFITVVVTKAGLPRPGGLSPEGVLAKAREAFVSAGGSAEKVVMIDIKSLVVIGRPQVSHPVQAIAEAVGYRQVEAGFPLDGMDDLARKEEQYLAEQLANESNWVTTIEQVPRVVTRTQVTTAVIDVPYHYECDCHKQCKMKFAGVCLKKKRVCGSCVGTRQEPRQVSEQVQEVVYEPKFSRSLAHGEEFHARSDCA